MNPNFKKLKTKEQSEKVIEFLMDPNTFPTELTDGEVIDIPKVVNESIEDDNTVFYFLEEDNEIIAAGGITENIVKSGGYELMYFAVKKEYRNKGNGSKMLEKLENFAKDKNARYITLETTDNDMFANAREFYESHGYEKVGHVPEYYAVGEGKVDYYKKLD